MISGLKKIEFLHQELEHICMILVLTQKKHNLNKICFHGLRHTSISLQIGNGIDVKTVSTRSGHSNTNTTLAVYTFQLESNKRLSADLFDNLINS